MSHPAVQAPAQPGRLLIPKAPVLVMGGHSLYCLTLDGELKRLTDDEARLVVGMHVPIACNAPAIAQRLRVERFPAYDLLELYAFIHPGKFCVPTPKGLARALNLLEP